MMWHIADLQVAAFVTIQGRIRGGGGGGGIGGPRDGSRGAWGAHAPLFGTERAQNDRTLGARSYSNAAHISLVHVLQTESTQICSSQETVLWQCLKYKG